MDIWLARQLSGSWRSTPNWSSRGPIAYQVSYWWNSSKQTTVTVLIDLDTVFPCESSWALKKANKKKTIMQLD